MGSSVAPSLRFLTKFNVKTKRFNSYEIQRRSLWQRGFRCCYYCDLRLTPARDQPNSLTLDHKIPLARGGANKPWNYVAACGPCNNAKGSMLEADFWRFVRARRSESNRKDGSTHKESDPSNAK